jgi:hypothetical protein
MKAIIAPIIKIGEAVAVWLNPERKELLILRKAIYAAEQIIAILDKSGDYKFMSDAKRIQMRRHFNKQLSAWRDGAA